MWFQFVCFAYPADRHFIQSENEKNKKKMGEMPLRVIYGTPVVL